MAKRIENADALEASNQNLHERVEELCGEVEQLTKDRQLHEIHALSAEERIKELEAGNKELEEKLELAQNAIQS